MSEHDGWDDAAEMRAELEKHRKAATERKLAACFPEVPEKPSFTVTFDSREALVEAYEAACFTSIVRAKVLPEARLGPLLVARELLGRAVQALPSAPVDAPPRGE